MEWAADLQNQLEQSETTCYKLIEENGELKQEIENLANEVVEVTFYNIEPLIQPLHIKLISASTFLS